MLNVLHKICCFLEAIYRLLDDTLRQVDEDLGNDGAKNKPNLKDDELLDIEQVRAILKIGRSTYYRLVNAGKLVPRKIGERHCYYLSDLEDMIRESKRRGRI